MDYYKTAITVDEQLAKLIERHMIIANPDHAKSILLSVGYYRMGFYWFPFEKRKKRKEGIHEFRKDATWEKAEALYDFDERFRNLLSFYLQVIETDIRTNITYIASNKYKTDPFWFVNPLYVQQEFVDSFSSIYPALKKNDVIAKHHKKHPCDTYAPAWKTLEFLMFGDIQRLFNSILDSNLRSQIFKRYNIDAEYESDFKSYINILRDVRNDCAHSHILYDKRLHYGIKNSNKKLGLGQGEEFTIVGILRLVYYMLRQIDPSKEKELHNNLRELVANVDYDEVRMLISRLAF